MFEFMLDQPDDELNCALRQTKKGEKSEAFSKVVKKNVENTNLQFCLWYILEEPVEIV
jgi:hypothetical protein